MMDAPLKDLYHRNGNLSELATLCDLDPKCTGFNAAGARAGRSLTTLKIA